MSDNEFIEVVVHGLTVDPNNNNPIVLLREMDGNRVVPIWIGLFEANAIAMSLSGMEPPRPMTHDILHSVISEVGYTVDRIEITDIKDNTYFAKVYLVSGEGHIELDSRPSDAIALSVRAKNKIYMSSTVLDQSSID
ncbi:MAG: bifunctional nuclease family protein, partial [bacterium]